MAGHVRKPYTYDLKCLTVLLHTLYKFLGVHNILISTYTNTIASP